MLYPILLNSHRSNYRYSNELVLDDTTTILNNNGEKSYYKSPFNHIGICLKSNKKRFFYPRPFYRGKIARACICLLYTSDAADDSLRVDLGGRRIIKKNNAIFKLQGNENIYVSKPELLLKDMESYLGKRIQIYHDYKW